MQLENTPSKTSYLQCNGPYGQIKRDECPECHAHLIAYVGKDYRNDCTNDLYYCLNCGHEWVVEN